MQNLNPLQNLQQIQNLINQLQQQVQQLAQGLQLPIQNLPLNLHAGPIPNAQANQGMFREKKEFEEEKNSSESQKKPSRT